MNLQQYLEHFERILNSPKPEAPYDAPDYFNYAKLNWSRMNRWFKKGILNDETKSIVNGVKMDQKWILITEPWCGDAAHLVPFIIMMARENENIQLDIELRDSEPNRIEHYLTNGGKSIPKLIVKDVKGNDLFTWGPRPSNCQTFFEELKAKNLTFEEQKIELQNWYNHDDGQSVQKELNALLKSYN